MKQTFTCLFGLVAFAFSALPISLRASNLRMQATADTIAVQTDEGLLLIPDTWIETIEGESACTVRLKGGKETITGVRTEKPVIDADFPNFLTFKFNNKYNDVLFADAEGVVSDYEVAVDVTSCIGKTLCPSFSVSDPTCEVYCNGTQQFSHAQRVRFASPVVYTVTRPGYRILEGVKQGSSYQYARRPWGRDVTVQARFATDQASSVPRVDITLDGGKKLSHITKENYLAATIRIDGFGVFPTMEETAVNIRGRGNSSWEQYDKKPYRLKFETKQKPFGLKGGKSWCLLAQARTGTLLTNPIALRVATMMGTVGANHAIPVELYINNQYVGSYLFTENPGFSNNSIDLLDESKAYMLELDQYFDDQWLAYDDTYQLTVNIKEPNLDKYDYGDWRTYRDAIINPFNRYTAAVRKGEAEVYEAMMDIDSWARFMLVNDLSRNTELGVPRSVKIYRTDYTSDTDPYVWGPVWDFDWTFGLPEAIYVDNAETDFYRAIGFNYGASASGFHPGTFFYDMLNNSERLKAARYYTWHEFMENHFDELLDYIDDYQHYVATSFQHDNTLWKKGSDNSAAAKAWIKKRAAWVYKNIPVYDLPPENPELTGLPAGREESSQRASANTAHGSERRLPEQEPSARAFSARGGKLLCIQSEKEQVLHIYTTNGTLLRTLRVAKGFHTIALPKGIYLVEGKKVVIG